MGKSLVSCFFETQCIYDCALQMSVEGVAGAVKEMLFELSWSRQQYSADYHLVKKNNDSVQLWSLLLCAAILASSALQVTFVRRLFHCPAHVTKERAWSTALNKRSSIERRSTSDRRATALKFLLTPAIPTLTQRHWLLLFPACIVLSWPTQNSKVSWFKNSTETDGRTRPVALPFSVLTNAVGRHIDYGLQAAVSSEGEDDEKTQAKWLICAGADPENELGGGQFWGTPRSWRLFAVEGLFRCHLWHLGGISPLNPPVDLCRLNLHDVSIVQNIYKRCAFIHLKLWCCKLTLFYYKLIVESIV